MPGRPSSKGYSRLSGSYESAPDEEGEDIKTEEVQDEGNEGEAKAAFLGLEDLQGDPHFVSLMILDHMLTEEVEEGDGGRCDDIAMMFINLTLLFLSHGCQLGLTYAFWKEFDAKNVHLNRDQWERNTGRFAWLMLMHLEFVQTFDILYTLCFTSGRIKWFGENCGRHLARLSIFALVILPKILVACFISCAGVRFIAHSNSNTELVLDCTALEFLLTLDDVVFNKFRQIYLPTKRIEAFKGKVYKKIQVEKRATELEDFP
ncbi:unnamed protein product [Durusdinium trenchii]|uniref:Uncharacterized protein n=1 Tax=Durusdinium trenchii TaxID=1381693 RepID=A0ABP0PUZ3_9DINO